jgi:Leucine-rich repeat (LRR) protein
VEYSTFVNNFATFQMRTDTIVRTGDNVLSLDVNLGNNTILCSKIFDKLHNLNSVSIHATNVVEIETNFLQGKGLDSNLEIYDGKFQTIKKHTFHNLEITFLSLFGNKITTIEEEAFLNLSKLKTLILDRNQLKELNPRSFVGLSHLASFSAVENVISNLQKNVFEFLQKRNVFIHLHRNCIETLDKGAFDGSNAANIILNLMHNRIEFLPPEIFQPGRFVRIDMYNNNISKIPHEFFEGDFYIELLNVDCNPLDAETVQALYNWNTQNSFFTTRFSCPSGHGPGNTNCHPIFTALAILFISCWPIQSPFVVTHFI